MGIFVFDPCAPSVMGALATPELVPCPLIVMVAFVSSSVAVTVTLVMSVATLTVCEPNGGETGSTAVPAVTLNADRSVLLERRVMVRLYVFGFPI
jgi:hypothetical protein